MELMPAHTQHTDAYCQNRASICPSLNLEVPPWQETHQHLKPLSYLRDLEITPVAKSINKSVTESNEWSSSVEAGTSRERSLKEKSDMENLLKRLPDLNKYFQLHSKIGEGTFSTVYLATLRTTARNYAVKHLTQNCQQLRIEREFCCMTLIGGIDNVVRADYCLTSGDDCVTFIMPYLPHKKFGDYVLDMNADETRLYMMNLFIALRRVHYFNIIHRDVKPGNFLYNRDNKQFLLVDFGLAEVVQKHDANNSTDENMPIDYSRKRKRKESVSDKEKTTPIKRSRRTALKSKDSNIKLQSNTDASENVSVFHSNSMHSEKHDVKSPVKLHPNKENVDKTPLKSRDLNSNNCTAARRKKIFDESSPEGISGILKSARMKQPLAQSPQLDLKLPIKGNSPTVEVPCDKSFTPLVSHRSSSGSFVQVRNSKVVRECNLFKPKASDGFQMPKPKTQFISEQCSCSGKGAICAMCSSRSKMVAPRAGTPGFRPPEVLFKYPNQTTAVDMWASGVILLCILSGCYPFFKSPNDLVALAEIMTVFGTEPIIKIAAKFGRKVVCSNQKKGVNLKKLCKVLRARSTKKSNAEKKNPNAIICEDCAQVIREDGCLCISDAPEEEGTCGDNSDSEFPDSAYDLLKRLLDLDPTTRITAAEALQHPFILGQ